jgi:hypothetical protein
MASRCQAFLHQLEQPQCLVPKTVHRVPIDHDVPRVHVTVRHIVERPAGVGHGSTLRVRLEQLVVDPEIPAEGRTEEEVVHLPELLDQLWVGASGGELVEGGRVGARPLGEKLHFILDPSLPVQSNQPTRPRSRFRW